MTVELWLQNSGDTYHVLCDRKEQSVTVVIGFFFFSFKISLNTPLVKPSARRVKVFSNAGMFPSRALSVCHFFRFLRNFKANGNSTGETVKSKKKRSSPSEARFVLLRRSCREPFFFCSFYAAQTNARAPAFSRAAGRTYNETARPASFCVQEAPTEVARCQFLLLFARGEIFIERRARAGEHAWRKA